MKEVTLVFPDTRNMMNFVFSYKLDFINANTINKSLTAKLSEDDIVIATTEYSAVILDLKGA